jgi:hypothetical protein
MGLNGNGVLTSNGTAASAKPISDSIRCPRRLVLLNADEQSEVKEVLAEYRDSQVSGARLHAELQRLAAEHPGACVAAEWHGVLGWTRFLWCRK